MDKRTMMRDLIWISFNIELTVFKLSARAIRETIPTR